MAVNTRFCGSGATTSKIRFYHLVNVKPIINQDSQWTMECLYDYFSSFFSIYFEVHIPKHGKNIPIIRYKHYVRYNSVINYSISTKI
jgi:hypothetical protein